MPLFIRILRWYYKYLGVFFPRYSTQLFWKTFTSVPPRPFKEHHLQFLSQATRRDFDFGGRSIARYLFGKGAKRVLLVHGWKGLSVDFRALIMELTKRQIAVEVFDLPGHGNSSGKTNNLLLTKRIVAHLHKREGYDAILGHSLGAAASFFAFAHHPELRIDQLVLMGMHTNTQDFFFDFKSILQIPDGLYAKIVRNLETQLGFELERDFDAMRFLPLSNVHRMLVIHDEKDDIASMAGMKSLAAAQPNTRFFAGNHGGHYHHYKHEEVVKEVADWLISS